MIQIDMEMPKSCSVCKFREPVYVGLCCCKLDEDICWDIGAYKDKRSNECPLKEQEPSEDAVSRQPVIDTTICDGIACNECSFHTLENLTHVCLLRERVMKLPPVTPQPKMGRWIKVVTETDSLGNETYHYECSECGCNVIFTERYCLNCGARMAESEETE